MLSLFKGQSIGYRSVSGFAILLGCILHLICGPVGLRAFDKFLSATGVLVKNLRVQVVLRLEVRRTGS